MKLRVTDFDMPAKHPYQMLERFGFKHTFEAERFLAGLLTRNIKSKKWARLKAKDNEDWLVEHDLLEKVGEQTYLLTEKAKRLLFVHYGKTDAKAKGK